MQVFSPFFIGGALAFVLNVPLRSIECHLPGGGRLRRILSLGCVTSLVVMVGAILLSLVIPQLTRSLQSLGEVLPALWYRAQQFLQKIGTVFPALKPMFTLIAEQDLTAVLMHGMQNFFSESLWMGNTVDAAAEVLSDAIDMGLGLVLAFYILACKENLAHQAELLMEAWLPAQLVWECRYFFRICGNTFTAFFSGQCFEALLLGGIFSVLLSVCRFPSAVLIGVVIGVTALIPVFGSFMGCVVGIIILLALSPERVFWFILLFVCVQQLEGAVLYPRVVGGKVGLPPLWVFIAVIFGGKLFGAVGMLLMIPVFGVLYTILKEKTEKRLSFSKKSSDKEL